MCKGVLIELYFSRQIFGEGGVLFNSYSSTYLNLSDIYCTSIMCQIVGQGLKNYIYGIYVIYVIYGIYGIYGIESLTSIVLQFSGELTY